MSTYLQLHIILISILNSSIFKNFFQILSAFQEMGMHEANNIALTHLALLSYETLRPAFPDIVTVLQQVASTYFYADCHSAILFSPCP